MKTGADDGPPSEGVRETTLHVRRAMAGDMNSLGWIVRRLSPLLLAQARYRLSGRLASVCDPEDLVADVWAVSLPRLRQLGARDGRHTPVLVRFLSTTLLYRFNNLVQKHIIGKPPKEAPSGDGSEGTDPVGSLSAAETGVVSAAIRDELGGQILQALERLDERDREVVVLRGIEKNSNKEVATVLGELPNTVAVRYKRALERLRKQLPDSVLAELEG